MEKRLQMIAGFFYHFGQIDNYNCLLNDIKECKKNPNIKYLENILFVGKSIFNISTMSFEKITCGDTDVEITGDMNYMLKELIMLNKKQHRKINNLNYINHLKFEIMTTKDLAKELHNIDFNVGISDELIELAKENNLAILYCVSDNTLKLAGAIEKEIDCFEGGEIEASDKLITAIYDEDAFATWSFETDIQHETFNIVKDGDLFCQGIVFSIKPE